jgi:hypothetical protein
MSDHQFSDSVQLSSTATADGTCVISAQNADQFQQPQQTTLATLQNNFVDSSKIQTVHPTAFFYQPPNELCNYHINCKEISLDIVIQLLNKFNNNDNQNEYVFYYKQQSNNQIFRVSCEIVFSLTLNKSIYGIQLDQNFGQKQLDLFTFSQKENLKFHLTQYLSHYLLN